LAVLVTKAGLGNYENADSWLRSCANSMLMSIALEDETLLAEKRKIGNDSSNYSLVFDDALIF
jgi:hypothetical protein